MGYSPKLPLGRQRLAPGAAVWARLSPIEQLPSDPPHHGAQGGTPRPAAGALPLRAPLRAAPLRAAPLRSAPLLAAPGRAAARRRRRRQRAGEASGRARRRPGGLSE